jgi:uncharacterized protein (TIGR03435 family)
LIELSKLAIAVVLFAWQGSAPRPAFEVVSIKINRSGSDGGTIGPRGSRLMATNVTLQALLQYAYWTPGRWLLEAQLIGEPNWARTERYDVEAKAEGDTRIAGEQNRAMMRSLLEDRFQLKAHLETRDMPVYNLVLAKNGPKLSEDQTPPDPKQMLIAFATEGSQLSPLPRGALRMVTGPSTTVLTGSGISVARIVQLLQGKSDRIVIDKSGVTGLLDVKLTFAQNLSGDVGGSDPAAPSLFTAIQQIGFKLEPAKAQLEVLVVDSVQRPSEQ